MAGRPLRSTAGQRRQDDVMDIDEALQIAQQAVLGGFELEGRG